MRDQRAKAAAVSAIPERRVRRTDLWIPIALFLGFLVASSIELIAERNTRKQTIAEMRRLEHVIVGKTYKPMDAEVMEILQTHDKDIDRLLEITRQQNVVARSIKNLQDKRGKRIAVVEKEVKNLKAEVGKERTSPPILSSPKSVGKRKFGR